MFEKTVLRKYTKQYQIPRSKYGGVEMDMYKVIYQGKEYWLLYTYTSGYCEIKESDGLEQVKLVALSDLRFAG